MAKDHVEYLSAQVLNDGQTVSYRTLSRALKVHSNLAKQMLYDFHHNQNKTKPGVLHATYLITGKQRIMVQSQQQTDGEDTEMRSSPMPSSPILERTERLHTETTEYMATSVLLVQQDHLENARSKFDQVESIHVYSIQPSKLNDLQILTECNRAIASTYAVEDPLETSKQYGTIQNSLVKRRPLRRQPQHPTSAPASDSTTKPNKPMFASKLPAKEAPKNQTSAETTPESTQNIASSSSKPTKKPPVVKRESSNLFKAFAKAKPKQDAGDSADPSPAPEPPKNDEPTHNLSDEEADDEDVTMLDEGAITEPQGKSKKEREEDLRRMMDMEDEPMEEAPETPLSAAETPTEEEPESKPESQTDEKTQETVTVTNGRRRGRRRVVKKKTVQDEEGYLVTREEPGWESFSEEEPAPKKPKMSAAVASKPKKAAPKGQGNIMSFFSKK